MRIFKEDIYRIRRFKMKIYTEKVKVFINGAWIGITERSMKIYIIT